MPRGQLPDLTLFLFCFEKLLVVYLRNRKKKCSVNAREMFSLRLLTGDLRLKRRRVLASGAGPEWPVPGGHRVLGTTGRTGPGALTLPGWASWSVSTDATHSQGALGGPRGGKLFTADTRAQNFSAPHGLGPGREARLLHVGATERDRAPGRAGSTGVSADALRHSLGVGG